MEYCPNAVLNSNMVPCLSQLTYTSYRPGTREIVSSPADGSNGYNYIALYNDRPDLTRDYHAVTPF